jgi:hypothetical protein
MKLLLSEVLQKVSNAKNKAAKIKLLQDHNSNALRAILIASYDESAECLLPEGEVPYTPNDAPKGTEHTYLEREFRQLRLFYKGGGSNLTPLRREALFIQLLEGLHSEEAEVICLAKDKCLNKKYRITRQVVEEAFPHIVWGKRS